MHRSEYDFDVITGPAAPPLPVPAEPKAGDGAPSAQTPPQQERSEPR